MTDLPNATTVPPANPPKGWWVIGLAAGSLLFSLGMFAWQIANDTEQLSGKVVSVATSSFSIIDARGRSTVVLVMPTTEIRGRTTVVVPGQFVHTFGRKQESGEFESESIQIVERRPRDRDVGTVQGPL